MDASVFEDITIADGALPPSVAKALRLQVIALSDRRDGMRPFWHDFTQEPKTFFEQVALALAPHVPGAESCAGFEWWMRAQSARRGYRFHFDKDEAYTDRIIAPLRSSILYLSGLGGPTLFVNTGPNDRRAPTTGLAVHPNLGRFATFPGKLFHGVLGGEANRRPRVAMFINWWRRRPDGIVERVPDWVIEGSPLKGNAPTASKGHKARRATTRFAATDIMAPEKWEKLIELQTKPAQAPA